MIREMSCRSGIYVCHGHTSLNTDVPYVPSPILPSFSYLEDTFGHIPYTNLDDGMSELMLLRAHEGVCEDAATDELLLSSS